MADIVTDVDLTELALRAQDQEIASLRKELRDTKLDHSSEVYDLREEIQNLREALNKYEQSAMNILVRWRTNTVVKQGMDILVVS